MCEALEENHAVKIYINKYLKYDHKVINKNEYTVLEVSIALDHLDLNNTLTLIDQTQSLTHLLIYKIEMSIDDAIKSDESEETKLDQTMLA